MRLENVAMAVLMTIAIAVALFAAGRTASTGHTAVPAASLPPDPHISSALLRIATVFNHDCAGRCGMR
jgi:hypothetical protein